MTIVSLVERLAGASCVVGCVLVALRWAIARAPSLRGIAMRHDRELALLETMFLPNGASVHVLRAGARRFVVGRTTHGLVTICELPERAAAPNGDAASVRNG